MPPAACIRVTDVSGTSHTNLEHYDVRALKPTSLAGV
ncbi:MAG: hypothetical protein LZF62_420035 [Nitrospira sp.]|nr:MAG: hypothetical protein LZF62_420035 [Nitrospira sp.]